MVVDRARRQIPARAGILEIADQFALLRVDANNRETSAPKSVSKITDVEELIVTIGTMVGGKFLAIDAEGIAHLMEEPGDGVGTDDDTEVAQCHGNLGRRSPRPLQPGDGITGSVVFEQELDQGNDVGGFFSTGLRPPPERRV